MKKKDIIGIIICFILSVIFSFGIPLIMGENKVSSENFVSSSLIEQDVISYSKEKYTYNKLYYKGQLVGVVSNLDYFNSLINNEYDKYKDEFPDTSLGLSEEVYLVTEDGFSVFEDKDEELVNYLIDNNLLGVEANAIEFSTSNGVYDVIYVNNLEDFYTARDMFLLNFVSEDTLKAIRNSESIGEPTDFGSVDVGVKIVENISYSKTFASFDEVFKSVSEVYDFLSYGRNSERQYYETKAGDTLRGIGYQFKNMSPRQLMLINQDQIFSEDQVLSAGMKLNVTYFSSPITVEVTKERLAQEVIVPDSPQYINDATITTGTTEIEVVEQNGKENVLYEETWVNGVLQTGTVKSSYVVSPSVQGIIRVGTQKKPDTGTGNYVWPVDNPMITCGWGCYYIEGIGSHIGTDFVNQYERYGAVYAADTGVVEKAQYNSIDGNYVVIDHQNGYKTHYGHMSSILVEVGQVVSRGEQIGIMGMTGYATGVHTHFHFIVDGVVTDACTIMDCTTVPWS